MRTIKFKSITLANFKVFRNFSMEFNDDVTNIFGRNESGKTTILDAITWCLFNKDHIARATFAIKTHDEEGKDIPNLEHSVELRISVDGVERTLKRTLKEKWTKPRGQTEMVFSGNYQECFIDGNLTSSTDYSVFISSFIGETAFKSITSPTFFLSLPWQEKRNFLQKLAGNISTQDITGGEERFEPLLEELKQQEFSDYIKHIKFNIKELKKKLDLIPVRRAEQEKAKPMKQNWENIETELKGKQDELDELEAKVKLESSLSPEELRRKDINEKIEEQQEIKKQREDVVKVIYKKKIDDQKKAYDKDQETIMRLNKSVIQSEQDKCLFQHVVEEKNAELEKYGKDKESIRERWSTTTKRKFTVSSNICSVCGQVIPDDVQNEIVKKAKETFNLEKAKDLTSLKDEAEDLKLKIEVATSAKEKAEKGITEIEEAIKTTKEKIAELSETKSYPEEVFMDLLIADEEYTMAEQKICELQLELKSENPTLTDTPTDDNSEKIAALKGEIRTLTSTLASKVQYNKVCTLIDEIEKESKTLAQQLAEEEKKEDIANEYIYRSDYILESRINKHFSLVKWRMFRTLVNGSREPYCECTFKGTEANNGLNSAGYIMAGIDICNAIAKFYNVSAPIIIDNAESINTENFIPSEGQQIRLSVSDEETLTIK